MDSAVGDLIQERLPYWRSYARSLTRNRADADDLVQDTVVRVLTSIDLFDGSNFAAWSNAILRNRFLDDCRRAGFRARSIEHLPAAAAAQEAAQEWTVELDDALRVLDELPAAHRNILVLKFVDDLSYTRTARQLKIPVGTVRSRLFRARAALSATLGRKRGVGPQRHACDEPGPPVVPPKDQEERHSSTGDDRTTAAQLPDVRSVNAGPDQGLAQERHHEECTHA